MKLHDQVLPNYVVTNSGLVLFHVYIVGLDLRMLELDHWTTRIRMMRERFSELMPGLEPDVIMWNVNFWTLQVRVSSRFHVVGFVW